MVEDYRDVAKQYWNGEYVQNGYKVVHDAGTEEKTFILAEREMDMFLCPTKEKCDALLADKENNPWPTFHDDFYKHPSILDYVTGLNQKYALDYGCGSLARYSRALAKRFKFVYAVDVSSEAIKSATKKTTEKNIKFIENDGISILLPSKCVDFVFSNLVLQHIGIKEVNRQLAREFVRLLKPGGILRLEYLDGANKKEEGFGSVVEGNGFTTEEITELYSGLGVEVLCVTERAPYLWVTGGKK